MSGRRETDEAAERLLREAGALLEGHFQLSSGRHSGVYVEKFRLLARPAQTDALFRLIADWARALPPAALAAHSAAAATTTRRKPKRVAS